MVAPAKQIGPDSGTPATSGNTWAFDFPWVPAPVDGTKLVMLHFTGASFPAGCHLEVDLAYGGGEMDVFDATNGTDFWTRPINVYNLPAGKVAIRYITSGGNAGSVLLDRYGRGERHTQDPTISDPAFIGYSNCDPFLDPNQNPNDYLEPTYAPAWFCNTPPNWENVGCIKPAGDIRNQVAPSVGMIIHVDYNKIAGFILSTCSVTLIAPDLVITAGHCLQDPVEDSESASIIFGYQAECNGKRPNPYNPQVCKVKEVIAQRFADGTSNDYCLIRLTKPVVGITPTPMRLDVPGVGEQVFGIHHPNGAVKKLSPPHQNFASVISSATTGIEVDIDVSGGSSGSGLFDSAGRIVGVLSSGVACSLTYFPTASIKLDMDSPTPVTRDVVLVFDRSGSMSLPTTNGQSKIHEAAAAASLFVQLVRANTGNKIGLVSFSTSANLDQGLVDVTAGSKNTLIGGPPYTGGLIGNLMASGATALGSALNVAYGQLPQGPMGSNTRNILLLTDGLQNMPPMADPNDSSPAGIVINAIGYGTPASLDGDFLTALVTNHRGLNNEQGQYVLADTDLKLMKFFALAFGQIFEAGLLMDPEFVLPAGQQAAAPEPFNVCEEETITAVVGWDRRDTPLRIELISPMGATITAASPGVQVESSHTWTFMRVPLPHIGERDGKWQIRVVRAGEFQAAGRAPEAHYFINVVAAGGAAIRRMPDKRTYYTGDMINPLVGLQYLAGGMPPNAKLKLTVSRPDTSVGTLLSREKLGSAQVIDVDSIPPRQATLLAIEKKTGKPAVGYTQHDFEMFDDIPTTGSPEPAGLFGNRLKDLLTVEGHYTFHVRASYGDGCTATRELMWSVNVNPGIDPGRSDATVSTVGGKTVITLVPRDKYGNHLGPGAGDKITVTGVPGTTVNHPLHDNGDGSYTVPVDWDPSSGTAPGVLVGQPGRGPVLLTDPNAGGPDNEGGIWKLLFWVLLVLFLLLLLFYVVFG
jgi:hypothetical protein